MSDKKTIAVIFGGKSAEHDISVLTGLQIIEAIDTTQYNPIPVYVDQAGEWWTGQELLNRKNYYLTPKLKKKLSRITLCVGQPAGLAQFNILNAGLLSKKKAIPFDVAFLAFHGTLGEDGTMQGLFEIEEIPFTGCRTLASSVYMNKAVAKAVFRNAGIPVLSEIIIERPEQETFIDIDKLTHNLEITFPVCAKPCNLGSSIGVHKANNLPELHAALLDIFKIDNQVIIEPFVEHLVEYNIAVSKAFGDLRVSAIERPIRDLELLSFKDKYLANGDLESKLSVPYTEGMASASREIHPKSLREQQKNIIEESAKKAFTLLSACGAPRIDFLCNETTGEVWLNEVNPFPGSAGYYLWEAATPKVNFTKLVDAMIQEALQEQRRALRIIDPKLTQANIFKT